MAIRRIAAVLAPAVLLTLGACATPFRADVARFQALPAPQGQSFAIEAADPRNQGGLEFSQYARLVAARLTQQGYVQAATPSAATLTVTLDYGVDNGREKVVTSPGLGFGYGTGFGYGRYGYYGSPWRYGRGAFFGGYGSLWDPFGPEVSSYTVFTSYLDMVIKRTGDGQNVFEGTAKARSRSDNLGNLVPNLVEAMFTNFPGRSGETVQITVPPPATARRG
jgi:hypothetical protein